MAMRYLKILGLAAVAALALMALGAAGSASATVLCKNKTTTEGCTEIYPEGTKISVGLVTNGRWVLEDKLKPGSIVDECQVSKFETETENQGKEGESVFASVEVAKYSFGTCTFPVAVTVGGKYEIEWTKGTDNGTIRLSNFRVTANLKFFSCIWKVVGEPVVGTVFGGAPATISSTNVFLERAAGEAFCPEQVTMRAPYQFNAPNALYVAKK
jgi:hypothetical protein